MNLINLRRPKYLLILILIVAAILRLANVTQPFVDAFSWRQASTAMMADNFYRRDWNIFYPQISWDGPGPSYNGREFQTVSYISALLYQILGEQDWIGRTVAVTFGVWGVFALYHLVRRVWDEERALVSAVVMALLPGAVFIDRSFLPDPAMVSLVTTGCWIFVAYLQTEKQWYLTLATLVGTIGFLSKLPGMLAGIPMLYAMVNIWRVNKKFSSSRILRIVIAAIFCLSCVTSYYLWARYLALTHPPFHFAGDGNWLWDEGLEAWISEFYFLPRLFQNFSILWTLPIILLVFIGLFLPFPSSCKNLNIGHLSTKAPFFFHWWFAGCLIYYLIGAQELNKNPWNFHIFNPVASALIAHSIVCLCSFLSKFLKSSLLARFVIFLILVLIFKLGHSSLKWVYFPYAEQSYMLGTKLHQISQPDDLVITIANSVGDPIAIYYSQRHGWVFPPAGGRDWSQIPTDEEAIYLFDELRQQGADWFGIVGDQREQVWKSNPKFMQHVERTCQIQETSSEWVIYRIPSLE